MAKRIFKSDYINSKEMTDIEILIIAEIEERRKREFQENSFQPRTFELTEQEIMDCPFTSSHREFLPSKG